MTDDVKKIDGETVTEIKEELANEPGPELADAAKVAAVQSVVAATEPEMMKPKGEAPVVPEGMVAMHPAQAAMAITADYINQTMPQGVHPAQAATYVLSAALSVLRQMGLSAKDANDLVIHFNQTWRLMTETKGQLPN